MSTTLDLDLDRRESELVRLTDAELARALFEGAERVADEDEQQDALNDLFGLIQEALERWAPDAERAETARNVRENEIPGLFKRALDDHQRSRERRAAARAVVQEAFRAAGLRA